MYLFNKQIFGASFVPGTILHTEKKRWSKYDLDSQSVQETVGETDTDKTGCISSVHFNKGTHTVPREQSSQFYPGRWESGRLLDLNHQGKKQPYNKRSWKMLVTFPGKPEVAFLGDAIFVDLDLLH